MEGERNGREEEQSSRSGARVAAHGGQSIAKVIQSGEARYPFAGGAVVQCFFEACAATPPVNMSSVESRGSKDPSAAAGSNLAGTRSTTPADLPLCWSSW